MIKLIAIDMDGTLLNKNHIITEKTLDVIKMVCDRGVKVILNTGRTFSEFKIYLKELSFMNNFVLCNGALMYSIDTDCFEKIDSVDNDIMKFVYDLSLNYANDISLVISSKEYSYTDEKYRNGKGAKQHFDMCGDILNYVDNLGDIISKYEIDKGVMFGDSEVLKYIEKSVYEKYKGRVRVLFSLDNALEIIGINTDKSIALEAISKKWGIDRSEIMAIGDGSNDIGMIKFAGMGIAMGNAKEEVKSVAKFITKDNNNDGVAFAISKYCLE